ncbi:MAG: hypothetical protein O7C03_00680 [Gammaproteobacteria bacterium]|nr:hypothetical protein [Gammaproteobacteria bacterium]
MAQKHFLIPAWLLYKLPALRKFGWMLEAVVAKALVGLLRTMSPERAARLANFLFRNLKPVLPFTNKIRGNLAVAFPEKDKREIEKITRSVCGNLGTTVVELVLAERIWAERDERIEFVMEEGIDLGKYRGRPAVMIIGHIGAWQIGTFVAARYNLRISSVYAPEENPYMENFILGLRSALPCRWISRDGCMRELTKELRQGNIVGLASDTRLDSGDPVPFFGVPVPTNTTAARLALRHRCDFFPVRVERLPGMRFRITVCPPIQPADPGASTAEQAQQMTQKVFEHFEEWIREAPDQWMCFGRRWPHEAYPQGSPAIRHRDRRQ